MRSDGGIAVGCNVKVIRLSHFNAVDRVNAEQWWQQAGFAFIGQWQADGGRSKDGYILKAHLNAIGLDARLFFVNGQLCGFQQPFGQPLGARGTPACRVVGLANDGALVVHKFDFGGLTVTPTAVQLEVRFFKGALKAVDLELQSWAAENTGRRADTHVACGIHHVLRLVVVQPIGSQRQPWPSDAGLTFNHQVHVGAGGDLCTFYKYGPFRLLTFRNRFLQQRAAAQGQMGRLAPRRADAQSQQQCRNPVAAGKGSR